MKANRVDRISNLSNSLLSRILSSLVIKDRGVKDSDLLFVPMLPALLFTSKTLVRLNLNVPYITSVPIHVCLPSLKTLELQEIKFKDDDSIKRLISSCPVLEDNHLYPEHGK
ncbi:F-box protein At4g09920-like [Hibiscus syriacus]|uniref:F-box protein At4g09920-like n=1 Tax=Hibiscus syriacus TaxID=106335 RepID=UPI001920AD08|nr:F-box protein At4g09920-like [Hibiscus syriacus]